MHFDKEINCGDPTNNISISDYKLAKGSPPGLTKFQSTVEVSCGDGFIYSDGTIVKLITCTASGSWTQFQTCTGIHNFIHPQDHVWGIYILSNSLRYTRKLIRGQYL